LLLLHISIAQQDDRTAEESLPIDVISPPLREWLRRPTSTKHRKAEDEQGEQTRAIPSTGDKVREVLEDPRLVVAEVELDEEAGEDLREDDASLGLVVGDVAGVLDELRHVELIGGEAADLGDELRGVSVVCWRREVDWEDLRGRRFGGR